MSNYVTKIYTNIVSESIMINTFKERLTKASQINNSLLCIGLDPDPSLMPIKDVFNFNKAIIDATGDLVCAYKPNLAFYEALGTHGIDILVKTVAYIHDNIPQILVLADAKRCDVDHTNVFYAKAIFDFMKFDGITVNPYLGRKSLEPFLSYGDKGVFVLCRTSNEGGDEFQNLCVKSGQLKLYQKIAKNTSLWNEKNNVALVVGATCIEELKSIRELCPDIPILIPGVGAQGGDLEMAVKFGVDIYGRNALINSSRGIIYASRDKSGFAQSARQSALKLRDSINSILEDNGKAW